jgi:hypothetical protein
MPTLIEIEPSASQEELQAFLCAVSDALRTQVDASQALAAPRFTNLRERLEEIADELECLGAATEPNKGP